MNDIDLAALNILIADENRFALSILRQHLRTFDAENLFEAHSGGEAYNILCAKPIDIALIDFDMAPVSGPAFVRMVRTGQDSPNPSLPIILLVENADLNRLTVARDTGASEVLTKPLSAKMLGQRILHALENQRAFVNAESFVGPDRRRRRDAHQPDPDRREN
ncbi:MAG: two-component system response regulator [Rhodobiaceae bacterium]|nr:two-component system response regulator [Rhodobiaceae bacterium]|tara:strand:+ start:316 stop:804 length:489 start_codon:yes stop_codon:yes gene_type:complete